MEDRNVWNAWMHQWGVSKRFCIATHCRKGYREKSVYKEFILHLGLTSTVQRVPLPAEWNLIYLPGLSAEDHSLFWHPEYQFGNRVSTSTGLCQWGQRTHAINKSQPSLAAVSAAVIPDRRTTSQAAFVLTMTISQERQTSWSLIHDCKKSRRCNVFSDLAFLTASSNTGKRAGN